MMDGQYKTVCDGSNVLNLNLKSGSPIRHGKVLNTTQREQGTRDGIRLHRLGVGNGVHRYLVGLSRPNRSLTERLECIQNLVEGLGSEGFKDLYDRLRGSQVTDVDRIVKEVTSYSRLVMSVSSTVFWFRNVLVNPSVQDDYTDDQRTDARNRCQVLGIGVDG